MACSCYTALLHTCPSQIEVPEDLPDILKEWSKSVLRANIETREQLFAFSAEYFGNLSAAAGTEPDFGDLEDKEIHSNQQSIQ